MAQTEAARRWLKQASHDLEMAMVNADHGGHDVACYLCHQAIEKLLKGLIIDRGEDPPRTHALDRLAALLGLSDEVLDILYDFSGDYALARYPDAGECIPCEAYDGNISRRRIEAAHALFARLLPAEKP